MRSASSGRGRRVAVCTALALSAGMLLASPASARDSAPAPALLKEAAFPAPSRSAAPAQGVARAGALAETSAAPLSDLDGDGVEDFLYRYVDTELYAESGAAPGVENFFLDREEIAKDLVAIGNQGGATTGPEVLVLSEDGMLTLYADATLTGSTVARPVGGGWQVYNKVTSPGDVNGDGRADVLARTKDGQLYLYLATGTLEKPLGARIPVGGGWGAYDQIVGLGDGDGDGKGDLYARDTAGTLWWYASTGDPARPFATRRSIGGGWNAYPQLFRAGGGALWARDTAGTLYRYTPRGDGTLNGRAQSGDTAYWSGTAQFAGAGNVPFTGRNGHFARDEFGTLYLNRVDAADDFVTPQQYSDLSGWKNRTWTAVSSLDADGVPDVLELVEGTLYADMARIGSGWGVYDALAGSGDLSGDGKGDLLARDKSGVLYLYPGNGKGTSLGARVRVGSGWGVYDRLVGAGDHTGDGRADLLARTTGGDLYLYAGTGSATAPFKARVRIGSGWNTYKHLAATGDMNGDGKGDLIGVTAAGTVYRYLNTRPGVFSARAEKRSGWTFYDRIS
ncbi:FG-GAP repeat domain-containing protein [Streptomyces hydrogenans]|uniref:FG-GAP repeat domain-containing protein n=1 Tax=Streptomyces hydrogenans TaxID=1873719 RepID=UPI0033B5F6A5